SSQARRRTRRKGNDFGLNGHVSALQSEARVDHRVEDVNHHVHDDNHRTAHQYDTLYHRKVAERDALVEKPADAGPGEHDFDDDCHIDHDDEVDPGQCQHRDQGVLERV